MWILDGERNKPNHETCFILIILLIGFYPFGPQTGNSDAYRCHTDKEKRETSSVGQMEKGFSSVQSLSRVQLSATSWITAHQASLSITKSWSLLKLMSIESVMPSNHLILCHPLLFLPSIFPSIRVFSNESVLPIRWPKYWSLSFSISPSSVIQD